MKALGKNSDEVAENVRLKAFKKRTTYAEDVIKKSFTDPHPHQHQKGPDYIIPTERTRAWRATDAVNIRCTSNEFPPESIVTFVKNMVNKYPNTVALVTDRQDKCKMWTYKDYLNDIQTVAKGFVKLGLLPMHGVGILGFNAPEWFISHFASIFAGGLAAGIYTTNSPDACYHVLNDCAANLVVVENEVQLKKILSIRDKLPNLKTIVQYLGEPKHDDVISWEELLMIGRSVPDEILEGRIKGLSINQCCCLIYTSGTTGNPKGAMLTHDNLTYYLKAAFRKNHPLTFGRETFVSYLPLSHIAALETDVYASMMCAGTVVFATPDALKGKLVETLTKSRPSVLIGVPRVWEKVYEKIKEAMTQMGSKKKNLLIWAQKQALAYHLQRFSGSNNGNMCGEVPCGYRVAKKLVLKKLKKMLGLNKVKILITGGAPLAPEIIKFFLSLDIVLYETYGLSESSGPFFTNVPKYYQVGSVGKLLPVIESKIDNQDEIGNGEILMKGRPIFMGYLNMENLTCEVLSEEGWFRTGDIGYLDQKKFLFITGRIKELIITSGGENVPPVPIEDKIKELVGVVSNCILIGDKRKFLSMLITLKTEINIDTLIPTDKLNSVAVTWCKEKGCNATTVSDVLNAGPDPKVMKGIQEGINVYNSKFAVSNAQKIQKWAILPQDFSIPGDELGPTMKLKRPVVLKKYQSYVEDMYKE